MLIWKTHRLRVTIASVRYRCLFPVYYLKNLGYDSLVIEHTEKINLRSAKVEALIFVKSFTPYDIQLCKRAKKSSIPIILDICDNIFIDDYRNPDNYKSSSIFREMAELASAIVTTGPALSEILKKELVNAPPIYVIPDGNETQDDVNYASLYVNRDRIWQLWNHSPILLLESLISKSIDSSYKTIQHFYSRERRKIIIKKIRKKVKYLISYLSLSHLEIANGSRSNISKFQTQISNINSDAIDHISKRIALPSHQKLSTLSGINSTLVKSDKAPKQVIWFGNHGAEYGNFGMLNLLEVVESLSRVSQDFDFSLLVISNSYSKYCEYILPLPFKTNYIDWDPVNIYRQISQSDITIIPNSKSPFSICKSANRAILSLSLGVPVVATATPALLPFKDCTFLDDWETGFRRYFSEPCLVKSHIDQAQLIIQKEYSGENIATKWKQVIEFTKTVLPRLSAE